MPISLKKLCGRKLTASDGNIGHVDDFYFEDRCGTPAREDAPQHVTFC